MKEIKDRYKGWFDAFSQEMASGGGIQGKMKQPLKIVLGALAGAVVGAGVGYFGKCASGTCPFTSDPVVSAVIFAALGAMITATIRPGK